MEILLTIPLYVYFGYLVIWFIFFMVAIYHMIKFGFLSFFTFFSTFIFLSGAFIILNTSYKVISEIDWQSSVTIFEWLM